MARARIDRWHILRRLRDFALYVLVALCLVEVVFFAVARGIDAEPYFRWGGLVFNTAVLFGYFIADSRPVVRRLSFWLLTTVLLCLHLTLWVIVLGRVAQWKPNLVSDHVPGDVDSFISQESAGRVW